MHTTFQTIAVIGAGVWGLTAAWLLATDGARVVLDEHLQARSAFWQAERRWPDMPYWSRRLSRT